MMMKRLLFLILFSLLPLAAFAQSDKIDVILNGINVVPDVRTPATGAAKVWVESDTLYVRGEFSGLMSYYYASNIHYGGEGENGNPIYKLKADISDDHTSGVFDPEKNKFPLSEATMEAFENGNLYITVASDKKRRGEIRGQINAF